MSAQAADTLCPQVEQLQNKNELVAEHVVEYQYSYGGTERDRQLWFGDGEQVVTMKRAEVIDELEQGIGGFYANWHMLVRPFYLPDSCKNQSIVNQYACIEQHISSQKTDDFWHIRRDEQIAWVEWRAYLPGPLESGRHCEWGDVEEMGHRQTVNYENFIVWDWDGLCLNSEEDVADVFDVTMSAVENSDSVVEPLGCADGIYVTMHESDEKWADDDAIAFFILAQDKGELYRQQEGIVLLSLDNDGYSGADLSCRE